LFKQIFPTGESLLASLTSAASLLGMPVEIYYYGTMFVYCSMLQNQQFYLNSLF